MVMCSFVTSDPSIIILVIRADLFYVKQCHIPETSPRSLGWNTGRSGFSEPGCHKLTVDALMADPSTAQEKSTDV